jgi:hypothetical protein
MNYDLFKNNKYIVGDIEWGGFGAMYARRKLIMQIGHVFNRTPIFRYTSYVYGDPFKPFDVNLKTLKEKNIKEIGVFNFEETDDEAVFFDFGGKYWGGPHMDNYQCWHPQDVDYLFYSGYLYSLLELKEEYKEKISEKIDFIKEKYEIENFDGVIGLHMRRGDKINETSYLSETFVFDLLEKIGEGKKIFITSDELDYIHEMENKYPNIEFIYDSDEKRYGSKMVSNVDMVTKDPSLREQETLTFMKNVEILKNCQSIIGPYSAQMTKIAGSINSFIKNKNVLYLINPENNNLEVMGNSVQTS